MTAAPPGRPVLLVMGQGYVGLPLALRAAAVGYAVLGYDVDTERVRKLRAAESYVEDVADADLRSALEAGSFQPVADLAGCPDFDVALITVPTPLRDGLPDLSAVTKAAEELGPRIRKGATVVLESTTYPGTTEDLLQPILEKGSGLTAGLDFSLGYSPERIDPGNEVWTLLNTPKVVSGIDAGSLEAVRRFYDALLETTVPVSTVRAAETAKLLENTFRHVNIALVNELAMVARDLDVDIWEVLDAAATKPFGFMRFDPGPGVGGHCLPVDPSYLSWQVERTVGVPFRFIDVANDVNKAMPGHVAGRVARLLERDRVPVDGAGVLVIGVGYKKNTGDLRQSPGLLLCRELLDLGARVSVADPHVTDRARLPTGVSLVPLSPETLRSADVVVVVSDHDAVDWRLVARYSARIFDTRHRMAAAANVEHL